MKKPSLIKILHLTDPHFPYSDPRAIKISLAAISLILPHHLVLGGDFLDAPGIAPFLRPVESLTTLQSDIDETNSYIDDCLKRAGPKCKTVFLVGNHEERLEKYLARHAPGLSSLRSLHIEESLSLRSRAIRTIPPGNTHRIGSLSFTHGDLIRKWAGSSARSAIEREGLNIVMGHSHRLGAFSLKIGTKLLRGFESGCLCDPRPHYMNHTPDWHRGFSLFLLWGPRLKSFTWIPIYLDQPNPLTPLENLQ